MFLYVNDLNMVMKSINYLNEASFAVLDALVRKRFYLRELAEELKLSVGFVHKIVSVLEEKKMILAEGQKNRKVFSLNYDSPLTRRTLSLVFLEKIVSTKAFEKLCRLSPKGIYLFGSASLGTITENSDIDLAIFFEKKADSLKLIQMKRELNNELGREIQLIVLTTQKIKEMKKQENELLNQIKNSSIVLLGERLE